MDNPTLSLVEEVFFGVCVSLSLSLLNRDTHRERESLLETILHIHLQRKQNQLAGAACATPRTPYATPRKSACRRRHLPVGILGVALLHSVLRAEVGRLLDGFASLEKILKSECSIFFYVKPPLSVLLKMRTWPKEKACAPLSKARIILQIQ